MVKVCTASSTIVCVPPCAQIGLQRERSPQPETAKLAKTPTEQPSTSARSTTGEKVFSLCVHFTLPTHATHSLSQNHPSHHSPPSRGESTSSFPRQPPRRSICHPLQVSVPQLSLEGSAGSCSGSPETSAGHSRCLQPGKQ